MNENKNKLLDDALEPTPDTEAEAKPMVTDDPVETMVLEKRKQAEPEEAADADADVVMIPRTTFNYVVIALVFFALGAVLGSFVFPSGGGIQVAQLPDNFDERVQDAVLGAFETAGVVEDPGLMMGDRYDLTVDVSDDPFLGNPNAPITIIEFSDFTCGFCGRFAQTTLEPILEAYPDEVRIVYMDFPFLSQMSVPAAMAAECAHDQGQFWEMHDLIFANQRNLTPDVLREQAVALELDMDAYDVCMEDQAHMDEIRADLSVGQELGVSGTPAFFVNGRFVSGAQPVEVFSQFIDEELAALES